MINRPTKGYVLMLDVLGFKDYISKQNNTDFFHIWNELKKDVIRSKEIIESEIEGCTDVWHLDILFLSDTIIICLSCLEDNQKLIERSIGHLVILIDSFFMRNFKQGIFFRGAISFGDFICDSTNNIAMGNAIEEAFEWHDSTDWIGIVLTPSSKFTIDKIILQAPLDDLIAIKIKSRFVEYKVPFKSSLLFQTYAFVWFDIPDDVMQKGSVLHTVLKVLSQLKFSKSIINKYVNTLAFIENQLCLNIDEYKTENTRYLKAMKDIEVNEVLKKLE